MARKTPLSRWLRALRSLAHRRVVLEQRYGPEPLRVTGPLVLVTWLPPDDVQQRLRADGQEVPQASGLVQVDTGASVTCISRPVAERLGLRPRRLAKTYGASGPAEHPVYYLQLRIHLPEQEAQRELRRELEVTGVTLGRNLTLQMAGREVELTGLLGRDLLRFAELRYDGSRGRVRFLFHPEEWQAMSSHR